MLHLLPYAAVVGVVFGVNLLPAFGPPTWAVLVLFRLDQHLAVAPLILLGAVSAATGRTLLALVFRHLRRRIPARRTANLAAAGEALTRNRARSLTGLALFALSPLPSAQLFEAAGLIGVALPLLTGTFFAGRLVSYTLYLEGANAAARTGVGHLITASFTSPWGVALEVGLLAALVALSGIDWSGVHHRHSP